jgi:hypothetical protein
MAKNYKITDPSGRTFIINMDHEPTDDELDTIVEKEKQKKGIAPPLGVAPPLPGPQLPAALDPNRPNPMPSGVAGIKASLFPTDQDIQDRDARVAYDVQHTPVHPPNLPTGQDVKNFITNPNHIAAALTAVAPKALALPINAANVGRAAYGVYQHPSFKGPETTDFLQSLHNFMMGGLSTGGLQEPSIPSSRQVGTGPIVTPPGESIPPQGALPAAQPAQEPAPIDVPFTHISNTPKVLAPGTPPISNTPTQIPESGVSPSTFNSNLKPKKLGPNDILNVQKKQKLSQSSTNAADLAKLKESGEMYFVRNPNYNEATKGQEQPYMAVAHKTPVSNLWLRSTDTDILKQLHPGSSGQLQHEIGTVLMERGERVLPTTPKTPISTDPAPRFTKYIQQRD